MRPADCQPLQEPQGSPCLPLRPLHWPLTPPGDKRLILVIPTNLLQPHHALHIGTRTHATHTQRTHTENTHRPIRSGAPQPTCPLGRARSRLTHTSLETPPGAHPPSPSGRAPRSPAAGVREQRVEQGPDGVLTPAVQSGCWPLCSSWELSPQGPASQPPPAPLKTCLRVVAAVWTPARRTKSWGHKAEL